MKTTAVEKLQALEDVALSSNGTQKDIEIMMIETKKFINPFKIYDILSFEERLLNSLTSQTI